ncbi:MAG: hypothetical protein FIA97_01765 [Methylococcaceae bacterium]|nr:hypothetical protein [Methylococcaceae bacterium]
MKKLPLLLGSMIAVILAGSSWYGDTDADRTGSVSLGHGDVDSLKASFDGWRDTYERSGGSPEVLRMAMGYSRALSEKFTPAHARVEFNLMDGGFQFASTGLEDGNYDLWFVDDGDHPGNTIRPDHQDKMLQVGSVTIAQGKGGFDTRLTREQLAGLAIDSVVLTRSGKTPIENVVIHGSPDLMTKLYYSSQLWPMAALGDKPDNGTQRAKPLDFVLPKVAMADAVSDLTPVLGALVAQGRQLFHNETFNGNGRNCGTCHRADNNFTLDPNYIAKLPADDPLFVAEYDPALADLENPTLMRKFGLILTNVDGAATPIFRSVPHTLALATSSKGESTAASLPYKNGEFPADNALDGAMGWSGDGAPGTGTLREFATGAVIQHFPKTMARNSDPNDSVADDFRLPTAAELDAIEAYSLSLGRSKDYPLYKLTFLDPLTQAGKTLFDTKENLCADGTAQAGGPSPAPTCGTGGPTVTVDNVKLGDTANCNGCHSHAGARSSTTFANPTRDTAVERMKITPGRLVEPSLAYDGGFGQDALTNCGPNLDQNCNGDGRFNTPPLIEAADTAPYFHNNSVSTLEEAIASYNSDAFNLSPGSATSKSHDRRVKLDSSQITAVASFLRAINALENIRQSNRLANQAKGVASNGSARELAKLATKENQDAILVLKEGKLLGGYAGAIAKLESANYYQTLSQIAPSRGLRNRLLTQAIARKQEAKALIATCNDTAAVPTAAPALVVAFPAPGSSGNPAPGSVPFTYSCAELDAL